MGLKMTEADKARLAAHRASQPKNQPLISLTREERLARQRAYQRAWRERRGMKPRVERDLDLGQDHVTAEDIAHLKGLF